jgi:beta-lactamase regulating signal transducer with metallopeptidase domain
MMAGQLLQGWWAWMSGLSVQVVILFFIVAGLDRMLRRRAWPRLLTGIWLLIFCKLLLPPTLASPLSIVRLRSAPPVEAGNVISSTAIWTPVAFSLWIAGVLLLLGWTWWRQRRLCAELQDAFPTPDDLRSLAERCAIQVGLRRPPEVRVVHAPCGPAVLGWWRPVIVLPLSLIGSASPTQLEHVLLHELTHIKRRDPLWSAFCHAVQIVYWFHPVVWIARRRLATLREMCCDEDVAAVLGDAAPSYRRTLLELARPLLLAPSTQLGLFSGPGP